MSAYLIVESTTPARKVLLGVNGRFVIGRNKDADLALIDPTVSRQHCVLTITANAVEVTDMASAGGTFVNGERVLGLLRLNSGDRIKVGGTVLCYTKSSEPLQDALARTEPASALAAEQFDSTMVRRPDAARLAVAPQMECISSREAGAPIQLKRRLVIGREPKCDLPLPSREISRHHAEIREDDGAYMVRDLSSTNGTFLDGREVRGQMPLSEGNRLRVGPYTFQVRNRCLVPSCQKGNVRIALQQVTKTVTSRDTGQTLRLLDNISFVIEPNEFVALLGTSGSGKSTLMDAMNGRRPASSGRVMVNEDDFYQTFRYYRRAIGFVPQQDIVHTRLTVEQAFHFTAELRLPTDTSPEEMRKIVAETIGKMGLADRRNTLVSNLSGGQLKRVSLGVELIADPNLLFLDEATSGLDAGTEAKMMALFRHIADEGKTVVCITHNLESINLCDLVVVLTRGKLAYYGPPKELPDYFGVVRVTDVYDRLDSRPCHEWESEYLASAHYQRYVKDRQSLTSISAEAAERAHCENLASESLVECLRQLWVLTRRYATITLQDKRNVAILLAQAPIIALMLGLVFRPDKNAMLADKANTHRLVVFLMAISAIWFGCSNAAKELVKELPIYLRERAVNLQLPAYLGSKLIVLSLLCFLQCFSLSMIVSQLVGLYPQSIKLFGTLLLTSLCGTMMGLLVSALVDNSDKAMAIVPILLIPQVIFASAIKPLSGLSETIGSGVAVSYWSFEGLLHTLSPSVMNVLHPGRSWGEDMLSLLLFCLLFIALSLWTLRRKDKLA